MVQLEGVEVVAELIPCDEYEERLPVLFKVETFDPLEYPYGAVDVTILLEFVLDEYVVTLGDIVGVGYGTLPGFVPMAVEVELDKG